MQQKLISELKFLHPYKYITLFVLESHVTPFHLQGSGSSGLQWRRIPSEPTIDVLKLRSASPVTNKTHISKQQL